METKPQVSPKDFFLHLGATIALYASVIALINLAFEIVNREFPDQLTSYFSSGSIAWPISMLIVIVPILFALERLISRDILRLPEKRDIWIRRWRIYLTLFLTGITIAVDVIVLINTYLNGEISSRFIWKVVIVLVISVIVFSYFILVKNVSTGPKETWLKILSIAGMVIVVGAIVYGFAIVGSPSTQRALRFDKQRINDLSNIQWQITNYWQKTGTLPTDLSDLNDQISNFRIPLDPETALPYEYISLSRDPNAFALCATFDLASTNDDNQFRSAQYASELNKYGDGKSDNWFHSVGHTCFERTIDPKLYPPLQDNIR